MCFVLSQDIDIATELVSNGFARWRRPPTPVCASDADDDISTRSGAASVAASVSDAQEEVVASS